MKLYKLTPGDIITIFIVLTISCIFYFMSYSWYSSINKPSWGIDTIPFFMLKSACFLMRAYNLYEIKKSLLLCCSFYLLMTLIIFSRFSFFICHNVDWSIFGFILVLINSGIILTQTKYDDKFSYISSLGVFILTLYQIIYLYAIKESNSYDTFQNI